jgi:outer membrane protein assembly factor BamB
MNRLAIRVMQSPTSSHIVYLDRKGTLIDQDYIPGDNSTNISLRDDSINCTGSATNTIYCYTLTGQQIWAFKTKTSYENHGELPLIKIRTFMWLVGVQTTL